MNRNHDINEFQENLNSSFHHKKQKSKYMRISKSRIKVTAVFFALLVMVLVSMGIVSLGSHMRTVKLENKVTLLENRLFVANKANISLKTIIAEQEKQNEKKLNYAVVKLNEQSRLIDSILATIGADKFENENRENTGGPFTQYSEGGQNELINQVDYYLEAIQAIPLGAPVPGKITSKYGRRRDPFNSKKAFHGGVDIRGAMGEQVKATAEGVVRKLGNDKKVGRYVVLDHNNGYETMFAHMKKILVNRGDKINRNQTIGLVGSSGRSTGPHLHYEIKYQGKSVNPSKYMKIPQLEALKEKKERRLDNEKIKANIDISKSLEKAFHLIADVSFSNENRKNGPKADFRGNLTYSVSEFKLSKKNVSPRLAIATSFNPSL